MRLERSIGKRCYKLPQSQVRDLDVNTEDSRKPMKDVGQAYDLRAERLLCNLAVWRENWGDKKWHLWRLLLRLCGKGDVRLV